MYSRCIFILMLLRDATVANGVDCKNATACYGSDPTCCRYKLECSIGEVIMLRNLLYGTKDYSAGCVYGLSNCNAIINTTMCCQYNSTDMFSPFSDEDTKSAIGNCLNKQTCSISAPRLSKHPFSSYVWIQYDCIADASRQSVMQMCHSHDDKLPAGNICKYIAPSQHTFSSNIFLTGASTPTSDIIGSTNNVFTPTTQFFSTDTAEHHQSVLNLIKVPLTNGSLINATFSSSVSVNLSQTAYYTSVDSVTQSSYLTQSISNTHLLSQVKDVGTSTRLYTVSSYSLSIGSLATSLEASPPASLLISQSASSTFSQHTSSIGSLAASLEASPSATFTVSQFASSTFSQNIPSIVFTTVSLEISPSASFTVSPSASFTVSPSASFKVSTSASFKVSTSASFKVSTSASLKASQFTSFISSPAVASIFSTKISKIFLTSVSSLTWGSTLNTLTMTPSFKMQEPTTAIGHKIPTKNALNYSRIMTTANDMVTNETITHDITADHPTYEDEGNGKGLIVGVAVTVTVFVLGLIIVMIVCIRIKRKQNKRRNNIRNTLNFYSFSEDYKDTKNTRSETTEVHHLDISQSRAETFVPHLQDNSSPYSAFNNMNKPLFFENNVTDIQLTLDPIPDLYSTADGALNVNMNLYTRDLYKEIIETENTEETGAWNIENASNTASFDPSSYYSQVIKEKRTKF